jgi:hypothetical protein
MGNRSSLLCCHCCCCCREDESVVFYDVASSSESVSINLSSDSGEEWDDFSVEDLSYYRDYMPQKAVTMKEASIMERREQYESAILGQTNLRRKRILIEEYEDFKSSYFEGEYDDRAEDTLMKAREATSLMKKKLNYIYAIYYTYNLEKKMALKKEYNTMLLKEK